MDPRRRMRRPPALRVRVPDAVVACDDPIAGRVEQNLACDVGDFVVRRGDGVFAYQLAVVSDDLVMEISDVIRGADLLGSTPRQVWLARELGAEPPRYMHVPLVVTKEGARMEKRSPATTIAGLRAAGVDASRIVGALAWGLGLRDDRSAATAAEVAHASAGRPISWRREPWPVPDRL
jgi:glutamyl-tRNA synthetase